MLESTSLIFTNPKAMIFCSKKVCFATVSDFILIAFASEEEKREGRIDAEKILFPNNISSNVFGTRVTSFMGVRKR